MISDIIVIYFIYVEEIWIFDSMIYSKTFFVLNMCEKLKMIIFRFRFNCFITNITKLVLIHLYGSILKTFTQLFSSTNIISMSL